MGSGVQNRVYQRGFKAHLIPRSMLQQSFFLLTNSHNCRLCSQVQSCLSCVSLLAKHTACLLHITAVSSELLGTPTPTCTVAYLDTRGTPAALGAQRLAAPHAAACQAQRLKP
jgi:hypothetical protein